MSTFWSGNRQRALARFPWLEPCLPAAAPISPHRVLATDTGAPALVVIENGKETAYTSRRDPGREAGRFADEHPLGGDGLAVLFGFALGYVAETLLSGATPSAAALLAVEPDAAVLHAAFSARDLSSLLSHPRFHLCTADSLDAAMAQVAPYSRDGAFDWRAHGPSERRFPREAEAARRRVGTLLARHRIEVEHLLRYGRIMGENVLRNAAAYLAAGRPSDLAGAWRGKPAAIVAAGPSIHKNLHQLAEHADRALILCVDTSLRLCLAKGFIPDAVVAVDPTPENFRHFEDLLSDERLRRIPLVFDAELSARVVESYPGPKWGLPLFKSETLRLLSEARGDAEMGSKGASVAHSAFHLARWLAADPLVFVGLDLAYTAEGATHAAGTALARKVDLSQCLWVEGVNEPRVPTSRALDHFRHLLEEEIAGIGARCIDCTEGGAKIAGTEIAPLRETLAALPVLSPKKSPLAEPRRVEGAGRRVTERLATDLPELRRLASLPPEEWTTETALSHSALNTWLREALFAPRYAWLRSQRAAADDAQLCRAVHALLTETLPLLQDIGN